MKLKLFLISLFVLIALVAYQKYSEYSALKSIDFPQQSSFMDSETTFISPQELNQGWYWGGTDQKKSNTPANWIFTDNGRSSCWHLADVVCAP